MRDGNRLNLTLASFRVIDTVVIKTGESIMNEAKEIILTELRQIAQLNDDVYNISVVLERFCDSSLKIEEIMHIQPIINVLRQKADILNAYFINLNLKNNFTESDR